MTLPALVFDRDGCTTTCIIITPPASPPNGALQWPTVLLFSKILPELISFTSFAAFGTTVLPTVGEKSKQSNEKTPEKEESNRRKSTTCM